MLSPIVPYSLLKMHWNPEHAQPLSQWPEQHLDVSSTTSSPAHKSELYPGRGHHGSYSHAWANDDISALTASNLLKRYAEKYTLDSPYDRPPATAAAAASSAYPEPFGGLCGPKAELEPWTLTHADGPYPLGHEGLPGAKGAASSAGGASGGNNSSLSDSGYSGSSSCSGSHSGDYPPSYSYLSSGYCPQPAPPTLVPGYSPTAPVYGYPTGAYPHQAGLAPGGYGHPPATYLPGVLAAPTPLPQRPTAVGGGSYGSYQSSGLGPAEPGGGGPLKRKAFEMSLDEGEDGEGPPRYRKYGYDPMKAGGGGGGGSSPYGVGDKGECRGSGFSSSSNTDPQTFKPGKLPSSQPLVSPPYGVAAGEYSPPAGLTGDSGSGGDDGDGGFGQRQTSHKGLQLCGQTGDPPGDPRLMLDGELLDRSPALGWGELCGLGHVKASLEEDLLWPALRPGAGVPQPPFTLLLFGPRGGGKTTLVRSLAAQLGAALFRVSGAVLASEGKAEAERALVAVLRVAAAARQPAVVLLSQAEALEEAGGEALPAALEKAQQEMPGRPPLLLVCATGRPDLLRDGVRRRFAKRYHVGLPDTAARRQVLLRALGPRGCGLGEAELGAVLRRSEGFSVWELLQLSQQALASSASGGASMHGLPTSATPPPAITDFENAFCKVRPHATPEELDACAEWSKGYGH